MGHLKYPFIYYTRIDYLHVSGYICNACNKKTSDVRWMMEISHWWTRQTHKQKRSAKEIHREWT